MKHPVETNISQLHIIRGLAALIVVVYHAKFILWSGGKLYMENVGLHSPGDYVLFGLDMLSSCGKQCVVIFFLLSAFVIKYSFNKKHYSLPKFFRARIIRIYLPYLASIAFSVIVLVIGYKAMAPGLCQDVGKEVNVRMCDAYNDISFSTFLKGLIFMPGKEFIGANFAYWSLFHEGLFYLLFPLYNMLKWKQLLVLFFAMFITNLFVSHDFIYYQMFFVAGLLFYEYFMRKNLTQMFKNKWVYIVSISVLYVAMNFSFQFRKVMESDLVPDFLAAMILFLAVDWLLQNRLKKSAWLMGLGNISYTLYLNHLPILMAYFVLIYYFTGDLIFYNRIYYYTGVVISLIFSYPIYLLVEKQSIKLLRK